MQNTRSSMAIWLDCAPTAVAALLGGNLMVWIVLDANAVIDYIRECALRDHGFSPTGRRAAALRARLDSAPHVLIPATAGNEARRNLKKDLVQKLGQAKAKTVMNRAYELLYNYIRRNGCMDEVEHVLAARTMYVEIRCDSNNQKIVDWEQKKGMLVADPVLGSDTNDLQILSTAAHYFQMHPTELWTHDMDFTMFADEIYKTFGLRVVDTYRLGGQFL